MLAAAADAMLAEAWQAFGCDIPRRAFEVICDLDSPAPGRLITANLAVARPGPATLPIR